MDCYYVVFVGIHVRIQQTQQNLKTSLNLSSIPSFPISTATCSCGFVGRYGPGGSWGPGACSILCIDLMIMIIVISNLYKRGTESVTKRGFTATTSRI